MTKVLPCRDIGLDCDHEARGSDEQEVVEKATVHLHETHGIRELDEELVEKMRRVVRGT